MAVQVRSVKALCGLSSSGWAGRSSLGQSSLGGLCLGQAVKVGCVAAGSGQVPARRSSLVLVF